MAAVGEKKALQYLRDDVAANSVDHRRRLTAGPGGALRSLDDLSRVPPTTLADVVNPAELVLRPSAPRSKGSRGQRAREAMEHAYKPVHWVVQEGVPIGSSAADLERTAALGARGLARSGVQPADTLVSVLPAGPHLAYWEVVLGARQLGVSAVHLQPLPSSADVARLRPSVLVGRPYDVGRLLGHRGAPHRNGDARGRDWRRDVRLVVAAGEPLDAGQRARLEQALEAPGAAVVSAWAPPGVRSLWWECPGGTGLHTSPEADLVEVVDPLSGTPAPPGADGEVVWTAVGWHGSVLVRLRTGVFAAMADGACPSCGDPGPRLAVTPGSPSFLEVLDRHEGVAGWQAELRTVAGREELVVFLALSGETPLERLLVDLDTELSATQYVVLDRSGLDARQAAHLDRRVVDLRT